MAVLKGWKFVAFISTFVGGIGITLYPIIIYPMTHTDEYKKIQQINRSGIRQEEIQPGNMKVWTDPFDRKKDK